MARSVNSQSGAETDDRTATEKWVDRLWARIEHEAAQHSGDVVVRLLREASTEVWDAGLDREFEQMEADDLSDKAPAFDVTWLSILFIKLGKEEPRKVRSRRAKDWRTA